VTTTDTRNEALVSYLYALLKFIDEQDVNDSPLDVEEMLEAVRRSLGLPRVGWTYDCARAGLRVEALRALGGGVWPIDHDPSLWRLVLFERGRLGLADLTRRALDTATGKR
jgi:hypothetical protein